MNTSIARTLGALAPAALALVLAAPALGQGNTCATATDVAPGGSYNGNTTSGATYTNSGLCRGSGNRAQWFKYTHAGATASLQISTCTTGSAAGMLDDSVLSVHSDCTTAAANIIACNDDACGDNGFKSVVEFNVVNGVTYFIRVSPFSGFGGTYTMIVSSLLPPLPPPTPGPDVTVWQLTDYNNYGAIGGITAFSVGTTSYNPGTMPVDWRDGDGSSASNKSPVIAQNLYKLKNGRFTQLGQSWLKHGFTSTNSSGGTGSCIQPPLGGSQLGINCLDTYDSGLNGSQNYLGARSVVNATTGFFPPVVNGGMTAGNAIFKRLQVASTDLEPSSPTVQYFGEGYYVTYDDATWGNALNNCTYNEVAISTATADPTNIGAAHKRDPAVLAWGRADPSVVTVNADHIYTLRAFGAQGDANSNLPTLPRDITCRYIVAAKVTDNGNGTWHYEYVVYNHNSDRSAYSFSVNTPAGALITNEGVSFPRSHSGEPYTNGNWIVDKALGRLTFKADATYAVNPNANAIRWGTMYTFWFDANVPPMTGQGRVTLFKPSYTNSDPSAGAPSGRLADDLATWAFANGLPVPRACTPDVASLGGALGPDGQITVDDIVAYLNQFFANNVLLADIAGLGGSPGADGQITVDDLVYFLSQFFNPTNCN